MSTILRIWAGCHNYIQLGPVLDRNGQRINLDSGTSAIEVEVKREAGGPDPALIRKVKADLTIPAQTGDNVGMAQIVFLPADTAALSGRAEIDVVVTSMAGERLPVVPPKPVLIGKMVNTYP